MIPLGIWDLKGRWQPNPILKMSAVEQYNYNIYWGHLPGKESDVGLYSWQKYPEGGEDMKVQATSRKKVEIFVSDIFGRKVDLQIRVVDVDTGEIIKRFDETVSIEDTVKLEFETSVEATR